MIRLVQQRAAGDCGTAALATLLSHAIGYEDVYVAAAQVERVQRGKAGLRNREVLAIARKLGIRLESRRAFDLDHDEGVLRVYGSHTADGGHWVAVRYALIWDPGPNGYAAPWREYAARHDVGFGTLLRVVNAGRLASLPCPSRLPCGVPAVAAAAGQWRRSLSPRPRGGREPSRRCRSEGNW